MTDLTELILLEHERILCLHEALASARQDDWREGMATAWALFADAVQTTMEAEEEVCYPALFDAPAKGDLSKAEAIAAHRRIRRAIGRARQHPVGSPQWWRVVKDALSACFELFDAEERLLLGAFQRRTGPARQETLGRHWLAFVTAGRRDLSQQSGSAHGQCGTAAPGAGLTPLPIAAVVGHDLS